MSVEHQDGNEHLQLEAAGEMLLELVRLVREHQATSVDASQRDEALTVAIARYLPLIQELRRDHYDALASDIDSFTQAQKNAAQMRHAALEVSGGIQEYIGLPCDSLERRMQECVVRYRAIIELQESGWGY